MLMRKEVQFVVGLLAVFLMSFMALVLLWPDDEAAGRLQLEEAQWITRHNTPPSRHYSLLDDHSGLLFGWFGGIVFFMSTITGIFVLVNYRPFYLAVSIILILFAVEYQFILKPAHDSAMQGLR